MGCYHAGQDGMENENSCFFTAFVEHYVKNKIMRDHEKKKNPIIFFLNENTYTAHAKVNMAGSQRLNDFEQ